MSEKHNISEDEINKIIMFYYKTIKEVFMEVNPLIVEYKNIHIPGFGRFCVTKAKRKFIMMSRINHRKPNIYELNETIDKEGYSDREAESVIYRGNLDILSGNTSEV
jgi:hypothetical protein